MVKLEKEKQFDQNQKKFILSSKLACEYLLQSDDSIKSCDEIIKIDELDLFALQYNIITNNFSKFPSVGKLEKIFNKIPWSGKIIVIEALVIKKHFEKARSFLDELEKKIEKFDGRFEFLRLNFPSNPRPL